MYEDLPEKLAVLTELARDRGVDTLVLREQVSLSWLLGARSNVPQTLESSCFDVVVEIGSSGAGRITVVTNAIEAPRLRDTELVGLAADFVVVPWWRPRNGALPTGPDVASDRPYADVEDAGSAMAILRRRLTSSQVALLKTVCRDAATAATAAALRMAPRMTEYACAGVLADELLQRGLDPVVLLLAGDERMAAHRHPLPTMKPVGRRAMLVCCARRHGLVASVTRIVAFGNPSSSERQTYDRLLQVERRFLDATRPGVAIGTVLREGIAAYAENGFDALAWHAHHQGGFSGWQPREFPANLDSADLIPDESVVAWNPSAEGWKVEDTCLVAREGVQPLVRDAAWPTVDVGGRSRPGLLAMA